jgi:hypothetical protein
MTFSRRSTNSQREFHGQCLVERLDRPEVEAVQALGRRELRGLDATFDHPAFPLDQFQFAEPEQVLDMILAFGRALPGQLGVFVVDGRQAELLEMVLKQHLRRVVHLAVPVTRLM